MSGTASRRPRATTDAIPIGTAGAASSTVSSSGTTGATATVSQRLQQPQQQHDKSSKTMNHPTSNTPTSYSTQTHTESDHDRVSRQHHRRRHFNATFILSSPTLLFSKIILIVTIVLRICLFPLQKLVFYIFPPGVHDNIASSSVSKRSAKVFVEMFYSEYMKHQRQEEQRRDNLLQSSSDHYRPEDEVIHECPFVENGYMDTIRDIATSGQLHQQDADNYAPPPLLLIYLHAPLHEKVPYFVQHVLCNSRIMSLIHRYKNSGTLTCWGGSIHTADGAHASDTLQVTCFPFMALVRVQPSSSSSSHVGSGGINGSNSNSAVTPVSRNLELLFRMEGPVLQSIQPNALFVHLSNALVKYEAILSEQTMRRLQRQEEVRLREEQDREYREALEADQRRESEKQEQQRLKEEQEKKIREEQERITTQKLNRLENARKMLNRNGAGEPDPNDKSVVQARIRLVLPSGKRLDRRFRGNDTVDTLRSFLMLYLEENEIPIENFELSCNYPKKTLSNGDTTLESEGLCPQAVIMVQDLDA